MDEFSLIDYYFKKQALARKDVLIGIGDDAAVLQVPKGMDLLVSTDTLVSGTHFLPHWDAYDIATKAVLATVSDMLAMAAEPAWLTLALTLPKIETSWLQHFADGLTDTLLSLNVALVGGDTTQGPLSITMTIMGFAPAGQALKRSKASPGDVICVTGPLGAAALALTLINEADIPQKDRLTAKQALMHPPISLTAIPLLRQYATAAIDISDGLSADLAHLCKASGVGACLKQEAIPLHPLLDLYAKNQALDLALTGGDDYEICFTVKPDRLQALVTAFQEQGLPCYSIGRIEATPGLRLIGIDNQCLTLSPKGYVHFKETRNESN